MRISTTCIFLAIHFLPHALALSSHLLDYLTGYIIIMTATAKLKKLSTPFSPKAAAFAPAKICCLLVIALLFGAFPTTAVEPFSLFGTTDAVNLQQAVPGFEEQQQHRELGDGFVTLNDLLSVQDVTLGALTDYLFFWSNGKTDANWQSASKGFVGDVAVNGESAKERTSGYVPYSGTIFTTDDTLGAWKSILNDNQGQASLSYDEAGLISILTADFEYAVDQINTLSATHTFSSCSSLNGLDTMDYISDITVIDMTATSCSAQLHISGDADDVFIIRWKGDSIKFQSGGGIVPKGGLTPANFVNIAQNIRSSGGGKNPPYPYPQGPRRYNGQGSLIKGGKNWKGGGFFTGYWLTTAYETSSLSNGIFVGGWYSNTTKFSMTSGTSGVYIPPICVPDTHPHDQAPHRERFLRHKEEHDV
jgi:hypothetical protein